MRRLIADAAGSLATLWVSLTSISELIVSTLQERTRKKLLRDYEGDDHIQFNCEQVVDFAPSLSRGMMLRPDLTQQETRDLLCRDRFFAIACDSGLEDMVFWGVQLTYTGYDVDSIMHYTSSVFAGPLCTAATPHFCPLTTLNGGFIYFRSRPSDGDVEGVKRMYPWRG